MVEWRIYYGELFTLFLFRWNSIIFCVQVVQKRGGAVIAARKLSSAMSAAKAAADHMKDWWNGTQPVRFVNKFDLTCIAS